MDIDLPRFTFDLGTAPQSIIDHAAIGRPKFGEITGNRLVIANQVVDKLYARHPKIADQMLLELPELLTQAKEVLPDHQNISRALIAKPFERLSGGKTNCLIWRKKYQSSFGCRGNTHQERYRDCINPYVTRPHIE